MSGFRNTQSNAGSTRHTHREESGWSSDEETVSDQHPPAPTQQREPAKQEKPFIPAKPSFDQNFNVHQETMVAPAVKEQVKQEVRHEVKREERSHDPFVNQPQKPRAQSFGQSSITRLTSSKQPSLTSSFATASHNPVSTAPPLLSPLSSLTSLTSLTLAPSTTAPSTHTATHTINPDEHASFVTLINDLPPHPHLTHLPINPSTPDLYTKIQDGLILAHLINQSCEGTIDLRVLNTPGPKPLTPFHIIENMNIVIGSCKALGIRTVNIGATDLMEGRPHLVLGLIWQIIRAGLVRRVDIRYHPELWRLLREGETMEAFLKLGTEAVLIRWFNYHLAKTPHPQIKNLSTDLASSTAYTHLLSRLSPLCALTPLSTPNLLTRADQMLSNASLIGCRKYLTPATVVSANVKLNFAFVAGIFNTMPGLQGDAQEVVKREVWVEDEGDKEARVFVLWLNSLGVEPYIDNFYDDIADGSVLLQAVGIIKPEMRVRQAAGSASRFKRIENTNYLLTLGGTMGFRLVGVQGSDICDSVKNLCLGFVWQLMREHVVMVIKKAGKGRDVGEKEVLAWINTKLAKPLTGFGDARFRTAIPILDTLDRITPGCCDFSTVYNGLEGTHQKWEGDGLEKGCLENAGYAIGLARKAGAVIFLLPEDILAVKPKMLFAFIGSLMALSHQ